MTLEEALDLFVWFKLEDQYADFILKNAKGDRIIANGDDLTRAMEESYLADEFIDSLVTQHS
jgi:hypothetical protein